MGPFIVLGTIVNRMEIFMRNSESAAVDLSFPLGLVAFQKEQLEFSKAARDCVIL